MNLTNQLSNLMIREHGQAFQACGLAVIKNGTQVINQAWGDIEGTPATPDTLFDLGSLTNLFTTTAFLSLVSTGRITLQTPLVEVIPEFGRIAPRPIDGGRDPLSKMALPTAAPLIGQTVDPAEVTFFHLLTHTSGLPAWQDVYNAAGEAPPPPEQPDPIPRETRWSRAVEALVSYAFVQRPGTRIIYSDIGLMLLGEAVLRLYGLTPLPLDQVIQLRILRPLAVMDIHFNPVRDYRHSALRALREDPAQVRSTIAPTEIDPTWRKRRVWGEVHDENACGMGGVAGHAGLFGTAQSVARFGEAWRTRPHIFQISPELAANAKREQFVTDGARRGLGFVLKAHEDSSAGDYFSPNTYGHTGFTGTTLWIDPDHQVVVALLTNNVYFGRGQHALHPFRCAVHDLIAKELNG